MTFTNPQGFFSLLLALPVIVVYLLRLHYRDYVVPSLYLWQSVLQDLHANRPWQKFKKHWLLFLQLAVLLLLSLSLAQPLLPVPLPVKERIFILVDISASMLAKTDLDATRFESALEQLHQTISTLRHSDNLTLITVGNNPRVILSNAGVNQVKGELSALSAAHGGADWAAAAQLTHNLIRDGDGQNVTTIIASDFAYDTPEQPSSARKFPGDLYIINVGDARSNAGIVHFSVQQEQDKVNAFVRIQNAGPLDVRTLEILADGVLHDRQTVQLPENGDAVVTVNDIPAQSWVEVHLVERDNLDLDDSAWAVLDAGGTYAVLLVTTGNRFLKQALENLQDVDFYQSSSVVADSSGIDTYATMVVDMVPLPELQGVNLWLIAPDRESICGEPDEAFIQPTHISGKWQHPLLEYVEWTDVHIERMRRYRVPAHAEVLLSSQQAPVLWIVENGGHRAVCTSFQLQDSDLPLRLAFPILTSNIMDWLMRHSSIEPQSPLLPGSLWYPPLPANTTSAILFDPEDRQQVIPVDGSGIILHDVGLYRYFAMTPTGQKRFHVAVSMLSPGESDLRSRNINLTTAKSVTTSLLLGQAYLNRWTTVLAILLCCIEAVLWYGRGFRLKERHSLLIFSTSGNLFALFLRVLLLVCLLGSLLDLRLQRKTRDLGIVFVVDQSESTLESWAEQQAVIEEVLENKSYRDQVAVVVFGRDAWVDRSLSSDERFAEFATQPVRDATDIEQAIRLAVALIPRDLAGRIVLLSDGLETVGDARIALVEAVHQGLDVLLLKTGEGVPSSEVWLNQMRIPTSIYPGDQVPVNLVLGTNKAQTVRINWSLGSRVGYGYYDLSETESVYQLALRAESPGFHSLRVCVEPVEDQYVANNCADNWMVVQGTPQVLVVGSDSERTVAAAAFRANGMQVTGVVPALMPQSIEELAEYSAVILVNTPARDLPRKSIENLDPYVSDLGGGLITIGGPDSYGVGGWFGTTLEKVLPVDMRVQDPQRFPPIVMALVIDTSGSMSAEEDGVAKIRIAAEAALRVTESLNAGDTLLVVGYSDKPDYSTGPFEVDSAREDMKQRLFSMRAEGGGIFVYESLDYAFRLLSEIPQQAGAQSHILILADGGDAEHQDGVLNLVSQNTDLNVSISTISIGSGEDVGFLSTLAAAGDGRFYLAKNASVLPSIFTEEVARVKRSYIVENTFYPVPAADWEPLSGITSYPPLLGYVATSPKINAQTALYAAEVDPVLSVWQYGLGRSAAWTSDASDRWSAHWINWDQFAPFWGTVLRDVMMQDMDRDVEVRIEDGQRIPDVVVDVSGKAGSADNNLDLYLRFSSEGYDDITLQLEQIAPGRYWGAVPGLQAEPYLVRLYGDRSFVFGWAPSPLKEYLPADAGASMAGLAESSGGRLIADYEEILQKDLMRLKQVKSLSLPLILTAAILWVCNIIWRRLALSWAAVLNFISRRLIVLKRKDRDKKKPVYTATKSSIANLKTRTMTRRKWKSTPVDRLPKADKQQAAAPRVEGDEQSGYQEKDSSEVDEDLNLAARLRNRLRDKDNGGDDRMMSN